MDESQIKQFLEKIAELESSSGKNLEHKTMQSGIHKGTSAIGRYGMMPNTVDEVIRRATRTGDPSVEMQKLSAMSPDEKKLYLQQNPELENQLAESLAGHVLEKQGGDEEKAAYSWLYGHNLSPEKVQERDYSNSPYVQRFRNLRKPAFDKIKKKLSEE